MAMENGLLIVAVANATFVSALLLLGVYQFRVSLEERMKRLALYLAWVLVLVTTSCIEVIVYWTILNGSELSNGIFIIVGLLALLSFSGYYFRHIAE